MHYMRLGAGKPLLLVHGLGGSWHSWEPILAELACHRELIAVDLPGHGQTPALAGETSIRTLADALTEFLATKRLLGIDAVGCSMGARLVLELARRGNILGTVVALDPGGFWKGRERFFFYRSLYISIRLMRWLKPCLPFMTRHAITRGLFFAQLSARPWRLSPQLLFDEVRSYLASPSFDELLYRLAYGEPQKGAWRGCIRQRTVIGWGRHDRVCAPRQAERAMALFPDARLHWFEHSGHFPHWDAPAEVLRLILDVTGGPFANHTGTAFATMSVAESRSIQDPKPVQFSKELDMNKDQIKGAAKKVGGKIEEATGKATRSEKLEAKGNARQAEGTIQKNYGDAKADVKNISRRP